MRIVVPDVCHDSFFRCVPWLIFQMCAMTHFSDVCHDSFSICVCERHDSAFANAMHSLTFDIDKNGLDFSDVHHDSFTCAISLIHMCAVIRGHMRHDSITRVPWLLHMCAMTHSHVWHDSFTCVTWLNESWHTCERVTAPLPVVQAHTEGRKGTLTRVSEKFCLRTPLEH